MRLLMRDEQLIKYYEILESLTDQSARADDFDRELYVGKLVEFCQLFRLAKGVTEFYMSARHEAEKDGEILIDYDNGHGDVEVLRKRVVPESGVVIVGTLYMDSKDEPLSEEELSKVDIVFRSMLSFIARNRLQKVVYRLGFFDADGYPNLRSFARFADENYADKDLSDIMAACINLKHFSLINQDFGRENGDLILRNYFEFLKHEIGENGCICRMGGDNFVMIFGRDKKDSILRALEETPIPYDKDKVNRVSVSARAGLYVFPEGFCLKNAGQIIENVYPALQIAKETNASTVYFDKSMYDSRDKILQVRRWFGKALENDEFLAYYQPKVDVYTGKVVGAEALCRWFRKGKMVMPIDFIPVLEKNMDICVLDFRMLEIVCKDIRRWLDSGRTVPRVSINMSRKHLVDPDILDHILDIVDKYCIPHDYIEIELTETTTDVEFRDLRRVVEGLQKVGISTSIDDFGNGYSSLNLLRAIPWDVLKIDSSLLPLDDEREDSITNRMYKYIVSMTHDIGLECITEGVETKKQVELLKKNKCKTAQGFYFDKAIPVDEFEKRMDGFVYQKIL